MILKAWDELEAAKDRIVAASAIIDSEVFHYYKHKTGHAHKMDLEYRLQGLIRFVEDTQKAIKKEADE